MSRKNYVIGMDCGTTNIKAVLLGDDGVIAAEASRPSVTHSPGPGMREQDPNIWWEDAVGIFRELGRAVGPEEIAGVRGICVSSHTVSMLPVDETGTPLYNAFTYQDNRSVKELERILETVGFDNYVEIVGGQPAPSFLPSKLLWYREHEPERFAKTRTFLQASSFINFQLTGNMTIDLDQATRTQCLDLRTLDWSKEIGDAIGVNLHEVMPPIRQIYEEIGTVTPEAALVTGLPAGAKVFCGCSDALAAMYATGMSRLGDAGESSGTSSLVFVSCPHQVTGNVPVVTRPCTLDNVGWVFDAPISSSGASIKWFIDTLGNNERSAAEMMKCSVYDLLNDMALKTVPGSHGLFFFPYLVGERAPLWSDTATGMFIGLKIDTSRDDLVRSVFEGTAYALRHVVETTKASGGVIDNLRICGGGARSRTWSMIKASMLHVPVYVLDESSGDVPVGDALIAGSRVGFFPDLQEAIRKLIKVKEIIQPIPEWEEAYDKLYPYYVKMYQDLARDLASLSDTLKSFQ